MIRFRIHPWFLVGYCAAALVVAVLAALYPSQHAARLQVIQALHYE